MKSFLFGSAAFFLLAGVANAADMPAKAPMKAPPPVTYDWNGFYIGGYFGGVTGNSQAATPLFTSGGAELNQGGVTIGGTLGYNWQFNPHWLVGVEGDFGWLGLAYSVQQWNDNVSVGEKADWYGTARLRFGYVTGPSLLYVTGGGAFVHTSSAFGGTVNTSTNSGWTAGGGIETKLSRSWTAKTEYLYIDVGDSTYNAAFLTGTSPVTVDHRTYHVVKGGLNYKFGEPLEFGPLLGMGPRMPSDHNWNGFYAGVNVGGGISNVHVVGGAGTVPAGSEEDIIGTGFAGGGQIGYNYMLWSKFLVGVEGDFGYLGVNASWRDWNDTVNFFDKTKWYGTARARVGTTTGPALLYFTAGAAWVNLTDTMALTTVSSTGSRTGSGWTAGGGTEVALDARWSARIESLYINVGSDTRFIGIVNGEFKDHFTVVRAGLNYAFGN